MPDATLPHDLEAFARRFERAAAGSGPTADERAAIWERLMAARPHEESPSGRERPIPGGGAAITVPASTIRPTPARQHRPDRRSLRFVPEMAGSATATLIIAVVALIGGMLAQLGSSDERGFVPSAFATEFAPATASASPAASPIGADGGDVWIPRLEKASGGAP